MSCRNCVEAVNEILHLMLGPQIKKGGMQQKLSWKCVEVVYKILCPMLG